MTDVNHSTDSLDTSTKEQISKCEAEIASLVQEIDNRQSMIEENVDENKNNEIVKGDNLENEGNQSNSNPLLLKISESRELIPYESIDSDRDIKSLLNRKGSMENLSESNTDDFTSKIETTQDSSKLRQTISSFLCCSASDQTKKTEKNKSQGLFSGCCSCTRRHRKNSKKKRCKPSNSYNAGKLSLSTQSQILLQTGKSNDLSNKSSLQNLSLQLSQNRAMVTAHSTRHSIQHTPQKNGDSNVYTPSAENRPIYTKNTYNPLSESARPKFPFTERQPAVKLLGPIHIEDGRKKCLIIDLDETLVHSSFKVVDKADFKIGVEIDGNVHTVYVLKRPFVDQFLEQIGPLFECVLFTASLSKYADPVTDLLDQWKVFRYRLFRESCVFHRGNYVKDLDMLGRDAKQVAILDNSPASYLFHPAHALQITSWFDDPNDQALMDLIPYFREMATSPISIPEYLTINPPPATATMPVTYIPNIYSSSTSSGNVPADEAERSPSSQNIIASVTKPADTTSFGKTSLNTNPGKSSSENELQKKSVLNRATSKSFNFLTRVGKAESLKHPSVTVEQSRTSGNNESSTQKVVYGVSPLRRFKHMMKSHSSTSFGLKNKTHNLNHNSMPHLTTNTTFTAPTNDNATSTTTLPPSQNTNNRIFYDDKKPPILNTSSTIAQKPLKHQQLLPQPHSTVRSASLCLLHSLEDIPSDDDDGNLNNSHMFIYKTNLCSDNLCNNTSHHLTPPHTLNKSSNNNNTGNQHTNNRLAITKLPFAASADALLSS